MGGHNAVMYSLTCNCCSWRLKTSAPLKVIYCTRQQQPNHRGSLQTALYGDSRPAPSFLSSRTHLNHLRLNHGSYDGVNSERSSLGYIKRDRIFAATIFLLIYRALHFDTVKQWTHKGCCSPLYGCQVYLLRSIAAPGFLILLTVPFPVWRQCWTKTTKVYTSSL